MRYAQGDILVNLQDNQLTFILHGCNCFHTMGAGIAKYLSSKYPEILAADQKFAQYGDERKLGTCCYVKVRPNLYIVNCYTQFHYGRRFGPPVNYTAIDNCLANVAVTVRDFGERVRSPKIGCGLAGGDWKIVEPLFEKHLPQATIYEKKETYHYGK